MKGVNIFRVLILLFVGIEVLIMILLAELNLPLVWFVTGVLVSSIGFGVVVVVALARVHGVRLRRANR